MKKLVSELSGAELDYLVGMAEELDFYEPYSGQDVLLVRIRYNLIHWKPSSNPQQAWPIIERDKIVINRNGEEWISWIGSLYNNKTIQCGETSLIAAMRCFVASKYGETVDV